MGRSRVIPYTVQIRTPGYFHTAGEWRTRKQYGIPADGKPTEENLRKWVEAFELSTVDGSNKHLGPTKVSYAEIVRQSDKAVLATYTRPICELV